MDWGKAGVKWDGGRERKGIYSMTSSFVIVI